MAKNTRKRHAVEQLLVGDMAAALTVVQFLSVMKGVSIKDLTPEGNALRKASEMYAVALRGLYTSALIDNEPDGDDDNRDRSLPGPVRTTGVVEKETKPDV